MMPPFCIALAFLEPVNSFLLPLNLTFIYLTLSATQASKSGPFKSARNFYTKCKKQISRYIYLESMKLTKFLIPFSLYNVQAAKEVHERTGRVLLPRPPVQEPIRNLSGKIKRKERFH